MSRRTMCVAVLVVSAVAGGCENKPAGSSGAASPVMPSRAISAGEFPDNPMLAFAPADAPYAFATFKPVPLEIINRMTATFGPIWRRAFAAYVSRAGDAGDLLAALFQELDTLDVKRFEELGFSAKARFVVYGIGAYPVMRVELSSGDRVLDMVRRVAKRMNKGLLPPVERAGRRYWIADLPAGALFAAIAPKELVVAFGPRGVIDGNLAALLGEQRPAKSLTTAQLRELAARDGFTGQGVGFVDLSRVGAMLADVVGASPSCHAAISAIAKRAPRLALGYDDLTIHRFGFGMVLELAPDLLADMRRLSSSLVGIDRLVGHKPAMAMAVAVNVEQGRTVLSRAAGAVQDLGQRCELAGLVDAATELASAMSRPLPPFLAGVRGGYVVVDKLKLGPRGPESIDGFAVVQLDQTGELLKLASSQLAGFDVKPDGKPQALPSIIPFPGHVAASQSAIAVALGANSATTVPELLKGRASPAPLAVIEFDYARLGELVLASANGPDADNMRDIVKAFGLATIQVLADERGLVSWMSFELR